MVPVLLTFCSPPNQSQSQVLFPRHRASPVWCSHCAHTQRPFVAMVCPFSGHKTPSKMRLSHRKSPTKATKFHLAQLLPNYSDLTNNSVKTPLPNTPRHLRVNTSGCQNLQFRMQWPNEMWKEISTGDISNSKERYVGEPYLTLFWECPHVHGVVTTPPPWSGHRDRISCRPRRSRR